MLGTLASLPGRRCDVSLLIQSKSEALSSESGHLSPSILKCVFMTRVARHERKTMVLLYPDFRIPCRSSHFNGKEWGGVSMGAYQFEESKGMDATLKEHRYPYPHRETTTTETIS